ncbi:hypothetical protein GCM10010302_40050 [Streptomyces polychromogenes]|uniref:HTH iclR-type domain-containing protein n=1 Tax=Streptomyces polychromogenes TaxID=67342 RepID=A0ABN0VG26_9ACTN
MHLTATRLGGQRLLPWDLDASRYGAGAARSDALTVARIAAFAGIWAVPVRSGPGGGRHVWLAAEEPLPRALVERLTALARELKARGVLRTVDVTPWTNPATGGMRVPGSAHRLGGYAELAEHGVEDAIGLLSTGSPVASFHEFADHLEALAGAPGGPVASHRPAARPAERTRPQERTRPGTDARPVPARRYGPARRPGAASPALPPSVRQGPAAGAPRPVCADADGMPHLRGDRRTPAAGTWLRLRTPLAPEADHSAVCFSVLLGLALAGYRHADVAALLRSPQDTPGLEALRTERGAGGARHPRTADATARLLERQWLHAVHRAARLPAPAPGAAAPARREAAAAVADLLDRIEEAGPQRWSRPSGPADLAVLRSWALLAVTAGSPRVDLDVRRAGQLSGYSHQTANAAIHRLIDDGWLREEVPAAPGRRQHARTLALAGAHRCTGRPHHTCAVAPRSAPHPPTQGTAPGTAPGHALGRALRGVQREAASDLWSELGHHCFRTYAQLRNGACTSGRLAQRTGYVPATVRRHLRRLAACGLVERDGRGRWARVAGRGALARAARASSCHGRGARRAARAARDVAVYRRWLEERRWLRTPRRDRRGAESRRPYPRLPDGRPDHARARSEEAARLGPAALPVAGSDTSGERPPVGRRFTPGNPAAPTAPARRLTSPPAEPAAPDAPVAAPPAGQPPPWPPRTSGRSGRSRRSRGPADPC